MSNKEREKQMVTNKTIANRSVDLVKARNDLVAEIDDLWTQYQMGVEQVNRKYFHQMGEKFIELRKMFGDKGKIGDNTFSVFCKKHWPKISIAQRHYWTAYRKRLGPIRSLAKDNQLPAMRAPKERKKWKKTYRVKSTYRRIVDEEMGDEQEQFEIPRSASEVENELIAELAGKIISAGFRVLSVKMHPDKDGGSNEAQRRLNSAKTLLQDALTRQTLRM
jgi:hypothetical protein